MNGKCSSTDGKWRPARAANPAAIIRYRIQPTCSSVARGLVWPNEAGGVVTAVDGSPWSPASDSVLVAAPGIHTAMVEALGEVN